jgi:hypothetical protein
MIELPDPDSVDIIADWVELLVLRTGKPLTKSRMVSLVRTQTNEVNEDRIDSAIIELERRRLLYGPNAPFDILGNTITPRLKWNTNPEYALFLLCSLYGAGENSKEGPKLFERLCCLALKNYIKGEAITLGFPNEKSIKETIAELTSTLHELPGGRKPTRYDKDRGVDVIAWKSHADTRSSQVVILLQCAAGLHWRNKKQVPLRSWTQYIHWGVEPIPGIGIPKFIGDEEWDNVVDDYRLIFDRGRILRALRSTRIVDKQLILKTRRWCNTRIAAYE